MSVHSCLPEYPNVNVCCLFCCLTVFAQQAHCDDLLQATGAAPVLPRLWPAGEPFGPPGGQQDPPGAVRGTTRYPGLLRGPREPRPPGERRARWEGRCPGGEGGEGRQGTAR